MGGARCTTCGCPPAPHSGIELGDGVGDQSPGGGFPALVEPGARHPSGFPASRRAGDPSSPPAAGAEDYSSPVNRTCIPWPRHKGIGVSRSDSNGWSVLARPTEAKCPIVLSPAQWAEIDCQLLGRVAAVAG